ncbi:coiled-coil domain-containing protein 24 [Ascaphus truei]|uniref:coiled-coil domain-containing protein 24 n=1 Tax=Ascaphus truei TaxID=8439 RepID=UPI003F5933FC
MFALDHGRGGSSEWSGCASCSAMLVPSDDRDSGYGDAVESTPSLWRLVEKQVLVSERAEIKRILGEAAIDLSLELHAEVEVLLGVWREQRSDCPTSDQRSFQSSCSVLADPPVIKDMVTQEIRMLLLSVRQKACRDGLDEDQALSKYNPKVVCFVMGIDRPESRVSRPSSVRSREQGVSRPQTGSSGGDERPSSSLSIGSSIEDDLETLKEKFNISDIDEVVRHLRSFLEEECRTLEKDISFLQHRLYEEHLHTGGLQPPPEPSLTELKEERRVIERDLQLKQSATSSFHSHRKMLTRTSNVSRPLDAVIRSPTENQHRVLSNVRPQSGCLQDNGPKVAPSPPNAKLKVQGIKKSSIVPIASVTRPSPNLPASYRFRSSEKLTAGVGEESVNVISCIASHSPIKNADIALSRDRIQGLSCPMDDLQKGPAPLLKVMLGQVLPSDCAFVEQTQVVPKLGLGSKGLDAVFVPSPPPVQRPAGGTNSFSTHRRVRTLQSNSSS